MKRQRGIVTMRGVDDEPPPRGAAERRRLQQRCVEPPVAHNELSTNVVQPPALRQQERADAHIAVSVECSECSEVKRLFAEHELFVPRRPFGGAGKLSRERQVGPCKCLCRKLERPLRPRLTRRQSAP